MECSIDGCENASKYKKTGWCQKHYHRYWRTGTTAILPSLNADISYGAAHSRTRKLFGSASKFTCIECGNAAYQWAYDGTDASERTQYMEGKYKVVYSVWPEFYMPLCIKCHSRKDRSAWVSRRTHCGNGHELTEETTYTRPSRPGTRECNTCKIEESRARCLHTRITMDKNELAEWIANEIKNDPGVYIATGPIIGFYIDGDIDLLRLAQEIIYLANDGWI